VNLIARQCKALRDAMRSQKELWRDVVHPWMVGHWRLQFNSAGGHGGQLWAPLEPQYAEAQRALGDSLVPLESSAGILEASFTDPTSRHHKLVIQSRKLMVSSTLPYSGTLATGGVGPYGESFPARDPRVMTPAQRLEIEAQIYAWFRRKYEAVT